MAIKVEILLNEKIRVEMMRIFLALMPCYKAVEFASHVKECLVAEAEILESLLAVQTVI